MPKIYYIGSHSLGIVAALTGMATATETALYHHVDEVSQNSGSVWDSQSFIIDDRYWGDYVYVQEEEEPWPPNCKVIWCKSIGQTKSSPIFTTQKNGSRRPRDGIVNRVVRQKERTLHKK